MINNLNRRKYLAGSEGAWCQTLLSRSYATSSRSSVCEIIVFPVTKRDARCEPVTLARVRTLMTPTASYGGPRRG